MSATARERPGLVGPLFWYEVTRQTRRGHGTQRRKLLCPTSGDNLLRLAD
jgi:hypothetical protein